MLDFYVSSEKPILELYNDQLDDYINIHNNEADPAHTVYCILPSPVHDKTLYWHAITSLVGSASDLVILTQGNLVIEDADFRHFLNILVSDNVFHRDGSRFLVVDDSGYSDCSILFKNCQAMNAHFVCSNLEWFAGRVKDHLFANLHGDDPKLLIEGTTDQKAVIGNLVIAEDNRPSLVSLRNVAIINNFSCEGVETLLLQDVKTGRGTCKLIVNEIEGLSNFQNLSDELIIKAEIANISSFISPIGKVYIDIHTFIEFKADGDGNFQGMDLNIDVSSAIERKIAVPFGYIKFDRISIKGASLVDIPGSVIAEEMEILNSLEVSLNESRIGHLKYQSPAGKIFFGKHSAKATKIDSLWLIGNIEASFQGASEVFDLDSEGRCNISIFDHYKGRIIKLNLNLNARQDNIESSKDGYFGFHVHNNGNKTVEIDTILAKLNSFNINGSVKLGQVLCQPVDKQYNLVQIGVKYLKQISIDGFFVGYDHNIVIDTNTGKISLVQSLDRALASSQIIASMDGSTIKNYLTIRAGQGLSFHGNIQVIEGDIELYTLFGMLSVRGNLQAGKQIRLLAIGGTLDLSAELDAYSIVTYSQTQAFVTDTVINANEFLAQVVGHYMQKNTILNTAKTTIISENSNIMIEASNIQSAIFEAKAKKDIRLNSTKTSSAVKQAYQANDIFITDTDISGKESIFEANENIGVVRARITSNKTTEQAGKDLRIIESKFVGEEILNIAGNDLAISDSSVLSNFTGNYSKGNIEISDSNMISNFMAHYSQGNLEIGNSNIVGTNIIGDAKGSIKVDSSQILSEENIFFRAVAQYFAVNSNIHIGRFPTTLFLHNSGATDNNNNPLVRCGFELKELEVLGILDKKGFTSSSFNEFQYHLVNSCNIELGVFQYIASENPKGIIIDANTGVIMGSSLNAKEHDVIIRTKHGMELLPLNLYNATMFSGGFNDNGISAVISKIEAGLIDIDGGTYIKSVGALLKANTGSLKADYIYDQLFISSAANKNANLHALKPWLSRAELYDMIVNKDIVPTKLEFSEVTKIDLGKGRVNLYYPYMSKQVYLRQREEDVVIDHDSHFSYEVMAVQADQGKIFFGAPRTEQMIFKSFFKSRHSHVREYHTIEHVNVTGNNLLFSARDDIDIHGSFNVNGAVQFQSSAGNVKIHADRHNFGTTVKQSVIRADNVYFVGENVEISAGLIKVKNHFKIFSHNDVKIIPIELINRYAGMQGEKTHIAEMSVKQIVSEINAGMLDIEAGRAIEFIGALIQVEGLNLKAKELNIKNAKEIFEKQVEFKGRAKWNGKRSGWSDYNYNEEIIPTVIEVGKLRMLVDNNATIEASQIFVSEEVLTQIGGNLTVKDGYKIHIHDYHAKKYSMVSFNKGGMKINTTKNIHDFHQKGEAIPTLVCAGGIFYGVVEGRMHVLGSTITGKDIHLAVPNGIKLEASRYTDKAITFVSETGAKLGYYHKGNTEVGVQAAAYATRDDLKLWETHINQSSLIASNSLSIIVKDGNFEQISSEIAAKIIRVEARNWIAKTYDEQITSKHIKEHAEIGIKLAVKQTVTTAIDKVRMLVNKRGSHVIDNLDRIFKAYDAYKSLALLPETAASGGLYAYLNASKSKELTNTQIAVDNTVNGESIIASIKENINFSGVKMTAHEVDIEAVNFNFETSADKYDYEYDFGEVSIDLDLMNAGLLSTASAGAKSVKSHSVTHHKNYIKASGNLKITLSGDGKFKGVSLEGTHADIKANNLILESVQDTISEKLKGANIHVGLEQIYNMTGFGGGVESGYKKAAWTSQVARIIGTQLVNIAVKETLEIAGGLIANAEEDRNGNLTDKGNLSINCGRMLVKTIHDYDEGVTLGVGASFQVKASEKVEKEGKREIKFDHAPLKVELKDKRREVSGVIGQGNINAGQIGGDILNRDITAQTRMTRNEEGSFDSVIHADMAERLTGNLPKRPVSVKKIDTEAVRGTFDPDPSLITRSGYYVSDIAENVKNAAKAFVAGGVSAVNFFGAKIDTEQLNARMDKVLGGAQYEQEFGSKLQLTAQQYEELVNQNLLTELANRKIDSENDKEIEELYNESGIVILQKSLAKKIAQGSENKPSLQALLHILKARYVKAQDSAKALGKSSVDFNKFVEAISAEVLNKNLEFAAKISKDFAEGILAAKQIVSAYIYKISLEKAKAEWEKEAAEKQAKAELEKKAATKQAKAKWETEEAEKQSVKQPKIIRKSVISKEDLQLLTNQPQAQGSDESLEESLVGYEEYLRSNSSQTFHAEATVAPNAESIAYANAYLEAQERENEKTIAEAIKDLPIIEIVRNAWNESQKDSDKRREEGLIPSHDYIQELYDNVYEIKAGDGHFIFKLAATMNQVAGASGRYVVDQAKQLLSYDPASKAVLNSAAHIVGYTIQAAIPDPALAWIGKQYKFLMGHFPTENERFLIELFGGILLSEIGGCALKMAAVPIKTGADSLLQTLRPSMVEVGINDISITKLSPPEIKSIISQAYNPNTTPLKQIIENNTGITRQDTLKMSVSDVIVEKIPIQGKASTAETANIKEGFILAKQDLLNITKNELDALPHENIVIDKPYGTVKIKLSDGKELTHQYKEINSNQNVDQLKLYSNEMRRNLTRADVIDIKDPSLKEVVNGLYRADAKVGSGSTVVAHLQESITGKQIGDSWHSQKTADSIRFLERWLNNNQNAAIKDIQTAEHLLKDMRNGLKEAEQLKVLRDNLK